MGNRSLVRNRRFRGQAMVITILALTILMTAAIALSTAARLELRTANRGVDRVRREALLRGQVNRGIGLLEQGRSSPRELLARLHHYGELRWEPLPAAGEEAGEPRYEIALQLQDASARLNLVYADAQVVLNLPGVDRRTAEAIASWQDPHSRDDFSRSPVPYEPSRRPFDSIEELLLTRDADPGLLFGTPGVEQARALRFPPLSELVTPFSGENNVDARGHARADVNTADAAELVEAAQGMVTELQAQNLVRAREGRHLAQTSGANPGSAGPAGGRVSDRRVFTSVGDALQQAGIDQQHWGPMLDAWTVDRRSFLDGRLNVNTVSPAVLHALSEAQPDVPSSLVDAILKARRSQPEGLQWSDLVTAASGSSADMDLSLGEVSGASTLATDLLAQAGSSGRPPTDLLEQLFSVRSSVYLVRVLLREVGSGRIDAVQATVYWPADPGDPARIVQWREPDRFPGWSAWYRPAGPEEGGKEGGKREP